MGLIDYRSKRVYVVTVSCTNCGLREVVEIPRGLLVGEKRCSGCGCQTLKKVS